MYLSDITCKGANEVFDVPDMKEVLKPQTTLSIQTENIHEPRHDKTNNVAVCPAKTHISLGIRPV